MKTFIVDVINNNIHNLIISKQLHINKLENNYYYSSNFCCKAALLFRSVQYCVSVNYLLIVFKGL